MLTVQEARSSKISLFLESYSSATQKITLCIADSDLSIQKPTSAFVMPYGEKQIHYIPSCRRM